MSLLHVWDFKNLHTRYDGYYGNVLMTILNSCSFSFSPGQIDASEVQEALAKIGLKVTIEEADILTKK